MLIIISVLVTLTTVVVIITRVQARSVDTARLGWMSQQWLAEHRASHSE